MSGWVLGPCLVGPKRNTLAVMRSRRATSFVLAAAVLCAAVRASAENSPVGVPPSAPRGPSPSGAAAFKTSTAQKFHEQFAAHEQNVLQHLTGRKTLTFAELRKRQIEFARGLEEAADIRVEERAALTAHLLKIGRLLSLSEPLARGGARLDSRLEKVLREAADASPKDPADALLQVSDQLLQAASNPQSSAAVFDNLSRRLGAEAGWKSNLDAVRADFGAKTPITFTPSDDPRTLAGIMSVKDAPPAPKPRIRPEPRRAASSGPADGPAAEALLAAYKPFRLELPDGAEKEFAGERQKELGDVRKLAEAAERSFGGDPGTMGFDALVDGLIAREGRVARSLGVGGDITDFSTIPARLAAIRKVNPELASFMAAVWLYRRFLRQEMADNRVALGATFKPWETFPDGQGTQGSTLEGYERDGARFVGLSYVYPDGSTRFQGAAMENPAQGSRRGLVILSAKDTKTITAVDFDGSGKVAKAVSDLYEGGALTRKEIVDAGRGVSEIHTYQNGKESKVTTVNADGRRRIQDLLHGLDTQIGKEGKVEIRGKPAPPGTPPVPILQVGELDAQGNFIVQKMVMQDGQQVLTKSLHVTQLLDAQNAVQGWNVEIGELVRVEDPAQRQAKAREYAAEIVKALFDAPDADKTTALAGFLLDYAKSGPDVALDAKKNPAVRLFINERKTLMLISAKKDGTRRIVSGVFKGGPEFEGHAQGSSAFGVMGEITADADGKVRQDDPTIQYEYLFDGSRLHWAPPAPETTSAPWYKFWQDDHEVTHFFIQREIRSGGVWSASGDPWESEKYKLERDVDGTSTTGGFARGINGTPILGQVLTVVGDGLGSIYKGAHFIVDSGVVGVMDLAGSDERDIDQMRVERDANLANNPFPNLIIGGIEPDPKTDPEGWREYHQKQVDTHAYDVTPGERAILAERARKEREKNLNNKGWTADRAPEAFASGMSADVSADEIYGAFSHFGAGSYGARLAEDGHPYLGILVQGTEVVVESLPAGFALGLIGKGAEGLQVLAETMPRASALFRVGELGLRGLDFVLKPAIVSQVALMGADHIGKAFQYRDDPVKFAVNAGNVLGDIAFGGLMLKGWLGSRSAGLDEMKGDVSRALDAQAAPPAAPALETALRADSVALDVKPTAPDIVIPPGGLTDDVRIPMNDGGAKIPAGGGATTPPLDVPTGVKAPSGDGGRPSDASSGKAPAAAPPAPGLLGRITSTLSSRLSGLLGRATVEAQKLSPPKTEAGLNETKVSPRAPASTNGPAGGGLEVRGSADGAAKGPASDKIEGAAKADSKPTLDASSAERIAKATGGEDAGKGVELKAGDGKGGSGVEEKAGDAGAKKEFAEKSEKAGEPKKTEKPDKAEEKIREPRTDRLGRWSDKLEGKTTKFGRFLALVARPLPSSPPGPRRAAGDQDVQKVDDGPVKPVSGNGNGNSNDNTSTAPDDHNSNDNTDGDHARSTPRGPTKKAGKPPASTKPAAADSGGGGAAGGGGGGSDKRPNLPGGSGGKGKGGGAGGGGGGSGGGGGGGSSADSLSPKGGAGAAAMPGDIDAAAPDAAHPAPFLPPPVPGSRSGVTPNGGGMNGGHSPTPSLASHFDGSRERPRNGGSGTMDSMKGLGAGDAGGLPHLTPRDAAPKAPVSGADAAMKDKTAASSAAPAGGAASPGAAVRPEDEDYNYTYLSPARHKYELPADRAQGARDWRYLIELGLQGSAALAAVYLFLHSDLGYLLGMTRRRKKTGGQS